MLSARTLVGWTLLSLLIAIVVVTYRNNGVMDAILAAAAAIAGFGATSLPAVVRRLKRK